MARKSMAQQEAGMRAQYRARDLEGMRDQSKWPQWPYLPMKRWDAEKHQMFCGVLAADQGPVIFMCNLFALPEDLGAVEKLSFESFEAILDAGWKVD